MLLSFFSMYLIHWPVSLRKGASHPIPKEEDFLPFRYQLCMEGIRAMCGVGSYQIHWREQFLMQED